MRKSYRFLTAWLIAGLFSLSANAQTVTISGKVSNGTTKESAPAVSIIVKGTSLGTYTNSDGEFSIRVAKLPVVLQFSSIGFDDQELTVSDASKPVNIDLKVNSELGREVVVAATRTPTRILESPVTIERMNSNVIRNIAAPSVYESLTNLKGVDVHTASLTFRTVTTRGFVSSGNTRLNQLVDGMDNQAPGLNFSVSSIVGLTDLDVDNIEILSGASSVLYGSGGMNGTVLISSKNPFKYQGLSYNIKQGIMHVDGKQRNAAPYYNWTFRYAKAFKNRIAFKLSAELIKGSDWQADDYRNKGQIGILSAVKGGNRQNDPNYNGINVYGDETDINMDALSFFAYRSASTGITGNPSVLSTIADGYFATQLNPVYPTNAQYAGCIAAIFTALGISNPAQQAALTPILQQQFLPFYNGYKNAYYRNTNISRTGYNEKDLVDYNTLNVKLNGGLHWMITDKIEASWNTYFGTGTTVYTGANRYSLRNFKMAQHKLEVKAKNWMVRGYTTQENAGDSYIGDAVGSFLNEAYSPSGSVWLPTYIATFSETRRNMGLGLIPNASDITIHNNMRATLDANRLIPGTAAFNAAANKIKNTPVNKPGGAKFLDKSDLYSAEGQLNFSDALRFTDKVEVIVGAQWKQWVLNSQGTIFADTTGAVRVTESGAYAQLKKRLLNDVLTLSVSGRYDKQTNFEGKFTPRFAAVIRVAKDNNIRLSYQSSYRFPSNQNQYISLRLGGGTSYLIGSLPEFQTYYKLNTTKPGYTAASVLSYRAGTLADSSRLIQAVFNKLKPESVNSYEIGYKGIIGKKLLVDGYFYYSQYKDFIVSVAVVQGQITGYKNEVYSGFSSNSLSYNQNSTQTVKSNGWGIGIEYKLIKNYLLYGNIFSDMLKNVAPGDVTYFNAPKYRYNIGLRNENVCHNIGFNAVVKYQDNNFYEGTFVSGTLPYFTSVDAQVTYRPPSSKSTFRVGGTNLGNNYYRTGYGSPAVGGLYYISYGFNL